MSGFEVQRRDDQEITTLYLKGYLDAHTYPQFETELQKLMDERRYKIIVHFSDLNYISSAGLGVFMGFIETVRQNAGDMKLCAMSPKVFKVFDLLGFPAIYEISSTEEESKNNFLSKS